MEMTDPAWFDTDSAAAIGMYTHLQHNQRLRTEQAQSKQGSRRTPEYQEVMLNKASSAAKPPDPSRVRVVIFPRIPCVLQLALCSLCASHHSRSASSHFKSLNTIEEFKHADEIWKSIVEDKSNALLNRFLVIAFADLPKY